MPNSPKFSTRTQLHSTNSYPNFTRFFAIHLVQFLRSFPFLLAIKLLSYNRPNSFNSVLDLKKKHSHTSDSHFVEYTRCILCVIFFGARDETACEKWPPHSEIEFSRSLNRYICVGRLEGGKDAKASEYACKRQRVAAAAGDVGRTSVSNKRRPLKAPQNKHFQVLGRGLREFTCANKCWCVSFARDLFGLIFACIFGDVSSEWKRALYQIKTLQQRVLLAQFVRRLWSS